VRFFIPQIPDEAEAENLRNASKLFCEQETLFLISERRIQKLRYVHERKERTAQVGEVHGRIGETVLLIFESSTLVGAKVYLVCSPNRGVLRGGPMLVGQEEVLEIVDFDSG
jgi:hypothetical protein